MKPWNLGPQRSLDLICMGRVAVDLYAEQIGAPLEAAQTFRKYLGGCAGNIAVGSARLGLRTAMFSCVGTDAMGQFVKQELQREGINICLLQETSRHLTGLVLLGVSPPDRFPLIFYRDNCADMQLKKEHVPPAIFAQAKALLITGTGLSTSDMRETSHFAVDTAKAGGTRIVFDLDYRPVLWGLMAQGDGETRYTDSLDVTRHYQAMLPHCDLIVGTEEEIRIAGGLTAIRSKTSAPIVLKRGAQGCCVYQDDMARPVTATAFPVEILNVLGAGDAFISGFLRGLLHGEPLQTCAEYANACGAIVVTRHGCAPAMPYYPEMRQFISNGKDHARISNT